MRITKLFVLVAMVLLSSFSAPAQKVKNAVSENQKPNIIFIMVDDMGFSDLGCYGSEIQTPNIDKLAKEGVQFTQFTNTAKCNPSRACLLTGLYAQQCKMDPRAGKMENAVTKDKTETNNLVELKPDIAKELSINFNEWYSDFE